MEDFCKQHSGMAKSVENIEKSLIGVEANIVKLFDKFEDKIVEYAQRPTWFVTLIISCLSGACTAMFTFILYAHFSR
jgi:hypothetical protein